MVWHFANSFEFSREIFLSFLLAGPTIDNLWIFIEKKLSEILPGLECDNCARCRSDRDKFECSCDRIKALTQYFQTNGTFWNVCISFNKYRKTNRKMLLKITSTCVENDDMYARCKCSGYKLIFSFKSACIQFKLHRKQWIGATLRFKVKFSMR